MNELQLMLWRRMIRLIGDYGHGKMDFHRMVDQLEGAMDTAGIRDPDLVAQWYAHWDPLDEYDHGSAYDFEFDHGRVQPAIEALRSFLVENLREWEGTGGKGKVPHPTHPRDPQ